MAPAGERRGEGVEARAQVRACDGESATNPLRLSAAQIDVLRELQSGRAGRGPDDTVWDEIEQLRLVESRESSHHRILTPAGRDYPTPSP